MADGKNNRSDDAVLRTGSEPTVKTYPPQFGWIPGTDLYSIDWWSRNLCRSQSFVREKCDELSIPYRRFGDIVFYSAGTIAAVLPELTKETDHQRKRGSRRKRKES